MATNEIARVRGAARFRGLRRRLFTKLLVAYAAPLVVLAAFFHHQYNATLREGIDNHLKSVAENQRNTVDLFLQERVSNLKSAFRAAALRELPPPGDPAKALETVLARLKAESTAFVDVGLFGPDGVQVAYSGPFESLRGKDYSREPWFRELAAGPRDHLISDVYLGFRDRPHFILAAARQEDGGRWILRASVDPERFGEYVRGTHLAGDAEALIVNRAGDRQTAGPAHVEGCRLPIPLAASAEARVFESVDDGGHEYLCAFASLAEIDWFLVVRVPADEAFAPLKRARWTLTGIMLVALLLIAGLGFGSTTRIVRQLERADEARAELENQLVNAAKLASVGEMAAGVAHEINNPLAIVHEEAGMMLDLLSPEFGGVVDLDDFRERLQAITAATIRGRNITSKLLAFARRHDTTPEPTDLNLLLGRVLEMKATEYRVSNVEVVRDLDPDLPVVLANANQLEQVFLNLLNNARDALPDRGRVVVRTRREDEGARVEIADDGCGMTEEQLARVFFPFFTTKEVGKGTGLGLSISYGIVRSHGGRIEVKSRVGRGTTVTVFLPADGPEPGAAANAAPAGREANV